MSGPLRLTLYINLNKIYRAKRHGNSRCFYTMSPVTSSYRPRLYDGIVRRHISCKLNQQHPSTCHALLPSSRRRRRQIMT